MTIRRSKHLLGGLNEVLAPEQLSIEDGQVQDCNNYEHNDDGSLTKRTDPAVYDANLTTAVKAVYGTKGIYNISEPFYPPTKPSDMDNEFMLLTYGWISSTTYETHMWFQKSDNSWVKATSGTDHTAGLGTAGITYTVNSDVKFTIADDKIIITDGVNRAHYIQVNTDGEFVSGILGIPAPTNKATMAEYTSWKQEYWEENVGSDFLTLPGLVQVVYTAVTEDGEESNPSPISQTLDLQFFKKDSDSNDDRWINKVIINNLSIPDVSSDVKAKLKYFNIYLRTMQYAENEAPSQFYFTQQVEIVDKAQTVAASGNTYSITVSPDSITPPSYENDVAPVAAESAYTGGIIMLGDVKTQISFPHGVFKYYHKITVSNVNSQSYVDAVIRINLTEAGMTSFEVDDWIDSSSPYHIKGVNHIRIYDEDLTTPIPVISCDTGSATSNDMDVLVSIPQLKPGNNTLYLCFTPTADQGSYAGVTDTYYKEQKYGEFYDLDNGTWSEQEVLNPERVLNIDSKLCLPIDYEYLSGYITNKDDSAVLGLLSGTAAYSGASISLAPYTNNLVGVNSIFFDTNTDNVLFDYETAQSKFNPTAAESYKFTEWFRMKYDGDDLADGALIVTTREDATNYDGIGIELSGGEYYLAHINENTSTHYSNLTPLDKTSGVHSYLVGVTSWYVDGTTQYTSVFTILLTDGTYDSDIINNEHYVEINQNEVYLGKTAEANTVPDIYIDQLQRINGVYYGSGTAAAKNFFTQIANFMPPFETMIGYDWNATTDNNNITFDTVDDTQTIEQKTRKNMLKYSDVNENSFPDLFYKLTKEPVLRIIPAPSFLQFEYGNTFIIFTRNFVLRFVLEGSASGWRASADSLIEEHKHFGLFDKNTLQRAGSALFWLSEQGVVQWDADGIKNISKNIVSIPFSTASLVYRSMFCHVNDQYWLHTTVLSGTTWVGTQYVFDIRKQVWTKFTDIGMRQAVVLTEGVAKDNINLILALDSGGTDNEIFSYPTSTNTTATAVIKTPVIKNSKGFVKSFIRDATGDDIETKVYTDRKTLSTGRMVYYGPKDLNDLVFTEDNGLLSIGKTVPSYFGGSGSTDGWRLVNANTTEQHRAIVTDAVDTNTKRIKIYVYYFSPVTHIGMRFTSGDRFTINTATLALTQTVDSPTVTVTRRRPNWLEVDWVIDEWGTGVLQIGCASSDQPVDGSYLGDTDEVIYWTADRSWTYATASQSKEMENNKWRRTRPLRGKEHHLEFENVDKLKSYGIEYEERGN